MSEDILVYERLPEEKRQANPTALPLINDRRPMCEHDSCDKPADVEYLNGEKDEDGISIYYTYRCDAHPPESGSYEVVAL